MRKIELQDLRLDKRYNHLKELSRKEFSKIKEYIDFLKNGESDKGIDIQPATERKYVDAFTMCYKALKKPLLSVTKEDLIKVKDDLKKGRIKSRIKKPYSLTSQRGMELILINFLVHNDPEKYSGFKKWFVIKVPKKDVVYLREDEIKKLYNNCKSIEERFLIAVLFDTGARASEFLNIRLEDITLPTQDFPYYKINLKEEFSKTKGRNIGLYWEKSTETIKDYLEKVGDLNPNDPIYPKSYDAVRIFLTRLGKKVLNKRVHFHLLRKASASYYATKLKSRQQLCYRYGWLFSSSVPDVYISRQQGEEEVKNEMVNTTIQKVERENQELKTRMILNQENSRKEMEEIKEEHSKANEIIKGIKDFLKEMKNIPKSQDKLDVYEHLEKNMGKSS